MPEQPERYDLDDMMDRLKRRSTDDASTKGELVTREDGSQVVRVRRRRRRSHQPHKERQRRMRMLQLCILMVSILLVILAIGFVTIYVNSAPFRKKVVKMVSATTGAEVTLNQFRMNPAGANAREVGLEWSEGNLPRSLILTSLKADVSPFGAIRGRLGGRELGVHTGRLVLQVSEQANPRQLIAKSKGDAPVHFDQMSIKDLEIRMEGSSNDVFLLVGAEATFVPETEGKSALLRMSRGDMKISHWPLLRLDRAHIELGDGEARIVGLRFQPAQDERGGLELSGKLMPHAGDEISTLSVKTESFPIANLLGGSLGSMFLGRVDSASDLGDCQLVMSFQPSPHVELSVAFRSSPEQALEVRNLPFLFALSQILGDEWFSRPDFRDNASGQILSRNGHTELSALELASRNRMAIRGHLKEADGNLSGQLEVGVANGMIMDAENQVLNRMFSNPRDGYRWIQVEISGSAASPRDNFSQLYELARERSDRDPQPTESSSQGSGFEELTRPR